VLASHSCHTRPQGPFGFTLQSAAPRGSVGWWGLPGALLGLACVSCLLPGCRSVPPAQVQTPWGTARAATASEARELALLLADLVPRVRDLLPDSRGELTEVWLDDFASLGDRPEVVGLAAPDEGRIRIRADRLGHDADFVLVHELVHALLGSSWDPLPAVMKEGLCDALSCLLVPEMASKVRAIRLFDAATAYPDARLELAFFEPLLHQREAIDVALAARRAPSPFEVLTLAGRGIHLHDDVADQSVLYGYGLVVTERIIRRIGLGGLNALCRQAGDMGLETVPLDWLLDAAELSNDPAAWHQAVVEEITDDELAAQVAFLAPQLASHLVSLLRQRFPAMDSDRFLVSALPTLGWSAGSQRIALGTIEPLRKVLSARWAAAGPRLLRPGEGWWMREWAGFKVTSLMGPDEQDGFYTITTLAVADTGSAAEGGRSSAVPIPDMDLARVDALIRIGRDDEGLWITSRARNGFEVFGVELEGLTVADLGSRLNVRSSKDADGFSVVTARLPGRRQLSDLALYHEAANLVIFQRPSGGGQGQYFPLWIPLQR